MRFVFICFSVVFLSAAGYVNAAGGRGIGITPVAIKINAAQVSEWPHTAHLYVSNTSASAEWIGITLNNPSDADITVTPGQFSLASGDQQDVLVTFGSGKEASGTIDVAGTATTPQGLSTGAGVRVRFSVAGPAVSSARSLPVLGAGIGMFVDTHSLLLWLAAVGILGILFFWKVAKYIEKHMLEH